MTDKRKLASMMAGRTLEEFYMKDSVPGIEVCLEVKGLSKKGVFNDINFDLKKGEILGISGMVGSGRSELAKAIFGIELADSGEIIIAGEELPLKHSPKDSLNAGLVLVPENKEESLILNNSVSINTKIGILETFIKFIYLNKNKEERILLKRTNKLDIHTSNTEQKMFDFFEENQQEIVIAKYLETNPLILILDEPTKGMDINIKSDIYNIVNNLAKSGASIIIISSELPEIINMSDRVAIMKEGHIVNILEGDEINQEKIMSFAV
ncbi:MAG TPA: sugar ABC transporter ATP-binding protein [Clostridiaceae bacterium]|nr:sugar ABC transporter ATP-binding protein [Clostridiaceae bacterium]